MPVFPACDEPLTATNWPFLSPDSDTLAGLVARLRDQPANDLQRLIIADWHDENGDEGRAAYIRMSNRDTQYLLWQTGSPAVAMFVESDASDDWHVSAGAMLKETAPVSRTVLFPALEGVGYTGFKGFVTGWRGPLAQWIDHGRTLCRREPVTPSEITFDDIQPRYDSGQRIWFWDRESDREVTPDDAGSLPPELFDMLVEVRGQTSRKSAAYRTYYGAIDDLRLAALRFALRQG